MRRRWTTVLVAFSLALIGSFGLGSAQDDDPLETRDFIPGGSVLGDGWILSTSGATSFEAEGTVDTRFALYLGPEGSRAYIVATRVENGAAGFRTAWAAVLDVWFGSLEDRIADPRTDQESETPDRPIAGCDEIERTWGEEYLDGVRVGITQCAVSDDFIVVTFVSNKFGPNGGKLAADRLMSVVLERAGVTTAAAVTAAVAEIKTAAPPASCIPAIRFAQEGILPIGTTVTVMRLTRLRTEPAADGDQVAELAVGTEVTITGPVIDGTPDWYPVRVNASNQAGFVVAASLEYCPPSS